MTLISADASTFNQLFSNERYAVPEFQRVFAWKKTHVNDFWEDLTDAISKDTYHFLGSIVLQKDRDTDHNMIFDGQQRLTVVVSLIGILKFELIEIAKEITDKTLKETAEEVVAKTKKYLFDKNEEPFLILSKYNQKFFVRCLSEQQNLSEDSKQTGYRANEFLYNAVFQNLRKKIKEELKGKASQEEKVEFLKRLFVGVTEKVYFVVIYADKQFSSATLFETLNFRGASLTEDDLFKSFLFLTASGQSKNALRKVSDAWEEIVATKDENKIALKDFLTDRWIVANGRLLGGSLHKVLKKELESNEGLQIGDYVRSLKKYLDLYVDIVKPRKKDRWESDRRIYRSLEAIGLLQYKECYPILLAMFSIPILGRAEYQRESAKVKRRLSSVIENLAFRLFVCQKDAGDDLARLYAQYSKVVNDDSLSRIGELITHLKKYFPNDSEFEKEFAVFDCGRNKPMVLYILHKLEKFKVGRAETISDDAMAVTVEHIMPKVAGRGWTHVHRYHERLLNRVGNLTLLSRGLNIGNDSFNFKKEKYYKESNVKLTKELMVYERWRKSEIEDRQNKLAAIAVDVWSKDI
jgi:uncharacterized protein with ParB-like and HNH nuclease domain